MTLKPFLLLTVPLTLTIACSPKAPHAPTKATVVGKPTATNTPVAPVAILSQTHQLVLKAVQTNEQAQTAVEWENSDFNPQLLFSQWRKESQKNPALSSQRGQEICAALLSLDPEKLSLFENEITNKENKFLLNQCQKDLEDRIERYYHDEKENTRSAISDSQVSLTSEDVKFADKVRTIDYSREGRIVRAGLARKEVALTFDDGPHPTFTRSILASLKAVNAKVHFFALGKSIRANPEMLKKAASEGHMIGSHTYSHFCIGGFKSCGRANGGRQLSFEKGVSEIQKGHQEVFNVLGWVDPIFRFPYGASTNQLSSYLKNHAIGEFFWSVDTLDWKAQTPATLLRSSLQKIENAQGGVVLFHDIQRRTAEMIPDLLRALYQRGYSIVLLQPADNKARYNSPIVKKKSTKVSSLQ